MNESFATPPFVAWSIRKTCAMRQRMTDDLPITCERYLRPLRAYGNALREDRLFQDVGFFDATTTSNSMGFPIAETLQSYGGAAHAEELCGTCDANIGMEHYASLAGCYGEAALPTPDEPRWKQFSEIASQPSTVRHLEQFRETNPRWYGLFLESHLSGKRLQSVQLFLNAWLQKFASNEEAKVEQSDVQWSSQSAWLRFANATQVAVTQGEEIDVQLFPAGRQEGRQWFIDSHCSACFATMNPGTVRCVVCGKQTKPQNGARRCARGTRPYMPLRQFLSAEEIDRLNASRQRNQTKN